MWWMWYKNKKEKKEKGCYLSTSSLREGHPTGKLPGQRGCEACGQYSPEKGLVEFYNMALLYSPGYNLSTDMGTSAFQEKDLTGLQDSANLRSCKGWAGETLLAQDTWFLLLNCEMIGNRWLLMLNLSMRCSWLDRHTGLFWRNP